MDIYNKLKEKVNKLIELAHELELTKEEGVPGDVSRKVEPWINEAIRQLNIIIMNLRDIMDIRYASPKEVSDRLYQIAASIKYAKNPNIDLIINDIQNIIKSING